MYSIVKWGENMGLSRCANEQDKYSYYSYIEYLQRQGLRCPWPYPPEPKVQKHVHEVQGSVMIAEREENPHNHRFATVTGEAIPCGTEDHFHEIRFRTDFYENHFHEFCGKTGGAIQVGDRHVHFLKSVTTENDGHQHEFRLATFIEDPIGEES